MADLIDKEILRFSRGFNDDGILYIPHGDIVNAASACAVSVVRCKDCKYGEYFKDNDYVFCAGLMELFKPSFYCADGERKDGDSDGTDK